MVQALTPERSKGERAYGLASVLYDVCNRVAVDATLVRADAYEVDLAVAHLEHTRPGDLVLAIENRADETGCPNVEPPQAAAAQLVPGQRPAFQRRCGGC